MIDERFILDAQHKERAYREIANAFASTNDTWTAIHSQFLSDLSAIGAMGQENPAFIGGGAVLTEILSGMNLDIENTSAEMIIEDLRNAIEEHIDYPYRSVWRERLAPLDYLRNRFASLEPVFSKRNARLEGLDLDIFIQSRFNQADEYANRANTLASAGRKREALEAASSSDLAAFEAWLIARSIEAGDNHLILTDIKWSLAMSALSAPKNFAEDFQKSVNITRARLAWVVGPSEARDLAKYLSKIG